MDSKVDVTAKFSAKYTQNDRNHAFSIDFRLDGRKKGRDQDFRGFPKYS